MNSNHLTTLLRRATVAILGGLVFSAALFAQGSAASQPVDGGSFLKRFSFGGRISFLPQTLLDTKTNTLTFTNLTYTYTHQNKSARVGGGPTIEFALTRKFSLSTDLVYHRFGYETNSTKAATVTSSSNTTSTQTTTGLEKTRAAFWDVPVLAHYSVYQRRDGKIKGLVHAGMAFRYVGGIHTATQTTDPNANTCCTEIAVTPAHRSVKGYVAGAGFRLLDDFGLKLTPEVRYTRWLEDTFSGVQAQARKTQLEVMFGVTF